MMILRSSPPSPFGRKVKLALGILGLENDVTIEKADPTDASDSIRQQNPLGKIPALIIEDGTVLYDSPVILEYLDHRAGGGKIVPKDAGRALQGADAAGAVRRHPRCLHPAGLRGPLASARNGGAEVARPSEPERSTRALGNSRSQAARRSRAIPDVGQITLACALGYGDLRFGGKWRDGHPKLVKWLDAFAAKVPAFEKTRVTA